MWCMILNWNLERKKIYWNNEGYLNEVFGMNRMVVLYQCWLSVVVLFCGNVWVKYTVETNTLIANIQRSIVTWLMYSIKGRCLGRFFHLLCHSKSLETCPTFPNQLWIYQSSILLSLLYIYSKFSPT